MPVRRERGGEQGERGRAAIASVLGIELETEGAGQDHFDATRLIPGNVNLIVLNKRASDFTPGEGER